MLRTFVQFQERIDRWRCRTLIKSLDEIVLFFALFAGGLDFSENAVDFFYLVFARKCPGVIGDVLFVRSESDAILTVLCNAVSHVL